MSEHTWKVGDWFRNRVPGDRRVWRIVDISDEASTFAYHGRNDMGQPVADWCGTWLLHEECEPCPAPKWWVQ